MKKPDSYPTDLTAEIVADYLLHHPEFWQGREDLLDRQALSHPNQDAQSLVSSQEFDSYQSVISLTNIQQQRQRQKLDGLEQEVTDFMALSTQSENTLTDFLEAQQQLFSVETNKSLINIFCEYLLTCNYKSKILLTNNLDEVSVLTPILIKRLQHRYLTDSSSDNGYYLGELEKSDHSVLIHGNELEKSLNTDFLSSSCYFLSPLYQSHDHQIQNKNLLGFVLISLGTQTQLAPRTIQYWQLMIKLVACRLSSSLAIYSK